MDKLEWCFTISNGITLIEPNENLSSAYFSKAENALEAMHDVTVREWKITTAYYCMYFSLYALFMRLGIKCENHSCTIEVMNRLLCEYFDKDDISMMGKAKAARVESQYYVTDAIPDPVLERMIREAPHFLMKCRSIAKSMDEKVILSLRQNLVNGL